MRVKLFVTALAAVLVLGAVPVNANDGHMFLGFGVAGNSSGDMVEVGQQILPTMTIEWGYPVGPVSLGFEISPLFFYSSTQQWGSEFDFGAVLGGQIAWDINKRWFVTGGGGWVVSNPLSDDASGEYWEGYEGVPGAQIVRDPVHPAYLRFTVGWRLNRHFALQVGTRNSSPYVAIGYTSF